MRSSGIFWCPALFKFLLKFHYETGPQTIFQGSSPRAALIRFSKLFRWSAFMRSPGDRGAAKPGKLRPSSFKASPQPSTPSRPTPSPVPAPAHPIQDPRKPQNCLGGGGDPPVLNRVQHYNVSMTSELIGVESGSRPVWLFGRPRVSEM